jgi:hypothetical protein
MQIKFVLVRELAFTRYPAFPGGNIGDDKGQEPQRVVRGDNWQTEHIAKGDRYEERLHGGSDFHGVTLKLVPEHSVEELSQRPKEIETAQISSS